jgi:hypothetical protein
VVVAVDVGVAEGVGVGVPVVAGVGVPIVDAIGVAVGVGVGVGVGEENEPGLSAISSPTFSPLADCIAVKGPYDVAAPAPGRLAVGANASKSAGPSPALSSSTKRFNRLSNGKNSDWSVPAAANSPTIVSLVTVVVIALPVASPPTLPDAHASDPITSIGFDVLTPV